ncbi:5-aminolevulic acid synthase [Cereibacter sphaeroides]|uniref:5-aminolevulic acid synthase n=1 Tax=Cereibacter sphaeroides TaxID=1063 RepID=UPI000F521111|nr:5-aminolevulic acid synthase [Cereibacter sphaeroides]AZB65230.1 5-aminolevulic acid synthase [Cereibacter sphaeroides]AZB68459.1 5-aminolevulic acid synthase [Cereibacter sphaeroides]
MRLAMVAALGILTAGAALAQPVTGREAKKMLFPPAKAEVEILPVAFLSENDRALLRMVVSEQPYYGAIAVSPDEGLASEATIAAANHHTTEAAARAALAACEEKRKGRAPCAIVGFVRPKGWKSRPLSLSSDATEGFRADYGTRGPRALAVSPATGRWGIGAGAGAGEAALAACAKAGGAGDCVLAVAD